MVELHENQWGLKWKGNQKGKNTNLLGLGGLCGQQEPQAAYNGPPDWTRPPWDSLPSE